MSDYIEVLDETDPGSNLVGDTLIHTDTNVIWFGVGKCFQDQLKIFLYPAPMNEINATIKHLDNLFNAMIR